MKYEITIQDIKDYLATKSEDEVIGEPMNGYACLAHNTLVHKYGLGSREVDALSTYYVVLGQEFDYSKDVEAVVDKFDSLDLYTDKVKKSTFRSIAPELF